MRLVKVGFYIAQNKSNVTEVLSLTPLTVTLPCALIWTYPFPAPLDFKIGANVAADGAYAAVTFAISVPVVAVPFLIVAWMWATFPVTAKKHCPLFVQLFLQDVKTVHSCFICLLIDPVAITYPSILGTIVPSQTSNARRLPLASMISHKT